MAKLDFIVDVIAESPAVSRDGFGTLLILDDKHEIPFTKVETLSELEELAVEQDSELYKLVAGIFSGSVRPKQVAVFGKESEGGLADAFNEVMKSENDFFYVVGTDNSAAPVLATAVTEYDKMYFVTVKTVEEVEAINEAVGEVNNEKVVVAVHEEGKVAEQLAGKFAASLPGETIAKFQTLAGINAKALSNEEQKKIHDANALGYKREKKRNFVSNNKTLSGQYIDVVIGKYYIKTELEEDALELAVKKSNEGKKIAYTNQGIAELVGITDLVMNSAVGSGLLLDYSIEYLDREEVSKEDRANRHYDGIVATGNLAGAIESGKFTIKLVI